jgi:hypothetical protein
MPGHSITVAFTTLEPYEGKLSRTVLWREWSRKAPDLSDPPKEKKLNVNTEKCPNQGMRKPIHSKPVRKKCTDFAILDGNRIWWRSAVQR